jgi:hypothetical protein
VAIFTSKLIGKDNKLLQQKKIFCCKFYLL